MKFLKYLTDGGPNLIRADAVTQLLAKRPNVGNRGFLG